MVPSESPSSWESSCSVEDSQTQALPLRWSLQIPFIFLPIQTKASFRSPLSKSNTYSPTLISSVFCNQFPRTLSVVLPHWHQGCFQPGLVNQRSVTLIVVAEQKDYRKQQKYGWVHCNPENSSKTQLCSKQLCSKIQTRSHHLLYVSAPRVTHKGALLSRYW